VESNRRPEAYESSALPTELRYQLQKYTIIDSNRQCHEALQTFLIAARLLIAFFKTFIIELTKVGGVFDGKLN
jgi:hypothetical protein